LGSGIIVTVPRSPEPCNKSHITRHTSHATRHTSHVTRHTSHAILSGQLVDIPSCAYLAKEKLRAQLFFRKDLQGTIALHTSHVTRHTSHVKRHTLHVTCHTSQGVPATPAFLASITLGHYARLAVPQLPASHPGSCQPLFACHVTHFSNCQHCTISKSKKRRLQLQPPPKTQLQTKMPVGNDHDSRSGRCTILNDCFMKRHS
jgi:hypothetical protein